MIKKYISDFKEILLPKGIYYVGDISYPLGNTTLYKELYTPGFLQDGDSFVVIDNTSSGNGTYLDNDGASYMIDSGSISIVSIKLIEDEKQKRNETNKDITLKDIVWGGHIHLFKHSIKVLFGDGIFRIYNADSLSRELVLEIDTTQ
jgi:hypothetical protein